MYRACSFTGHRYIARQHEQQLRSLVARAIEYTYANGCRTYYCGGALGFDTMAALEVIKYRVLHPDVRLCLLLPCINQDECWSPEQRERYEYILSLADHTEYISDEYTRGCMRERNLRLVARSDVLIAYCGRQNSGAAQTVRAAKERGIDIFNLFASASRPE